MECKKCMGELIYDEVGGTYYCPTCHVLYDKDDIVEKYEEDVDSEEWEEEELNGLSLTVLHLMMCIPIVSIFVPIMIGNANVKKEYNRSFGYRFLSQVIILICLLMLYITVYVNHRQEAHKMVNTVMSYASDIMDKKHKDMTSKIDVPKSNINIDELFRPTVDEEQTDVESLLLGDISYLSGAMMDGTNALKLVDKLKGYQCAILIQSKDVADRHGANSYRNVGYILNGATTDSSGKTATYYVTPTDLTGFYTDDYGELICVSIDDLKNSKYIFYLNPKKYYSVIPLTGSDDVTLGVAFKEVDIK